MTDNLDYLIEIGRPYLTQYLTDMGVKIDKHGSTNFFRCINPNHEDRTPSTCFLPKTNDEVFFCHGCQSTGDIFQAAAYLEDKPAYGLEFITENIYYILSKYGVEFEEIEFSEERLNKFRHEKVYESVYELMTARDTTSRKLLFTDIQSITEERGWSEKICLDFGIGIIKDYTKFMTTLTNILKIPIPELQNMGITPNQFGPDYITFCIRDHLGKVQGFVSRKRNWNKKDPDPKYRNTSVEQNPFYRKDQILYGLDRAKKFKDLRLDIFEGYGSCVTAHQHNHRQSCSLGGTALTEKHVDLIMDLGIQHINLVLDVDSTGQEKMARYIEKFSNKSGLIVTVTKLPIPTEELAVKGQNDPDYFIQKNGIEVFRTLKPQGIFEHQIAKHDEFNEDDPLALEFAKVMIPLIINEPDHMKRGKMITALSNHTKVDKDDIRNEVNRLEQKDEDSLRLQTIRRLNRGESLEEVVYDVSSKLTSTPTSASEKQLLSLSETLDHFDNIFTDMNSTKTGIHGWKTGYDALDNMLDGIPKPGQTGGRLIGFAGAPSHAKSASLLNICLNVALNNDDCSIMFWAIDDNRKAIAYRLIAMISGVPMKKVLNIEPRTEGEGKKVREAQSFLRQLVLDQKFIFKDDKLGRERSKAENWIKHVQDTTGNNTLFCIDSLHNIQGDEGEETRVKILKSSAWAKKMVTKSNCTILTTLELNKARDKTKPTLLQISESAKVEFDFDTIAIVWNEMQGTYGSGPIEKAWIDEDGKQWPIIELDFQKNKCGAGEKGSLYFRLDGRTTKFIDCDTKFTKLGVSSSVSIEI